ncbi:TPA: hypothetical protein DCW54_01220 [Candidatus Dependentiae bacterium]|nr:hypothetical protein [Candidatus Dependentiae bacterium]
MKKQILLVGCSFLYGACASACFDFSLVDREFEKIDRAAKQFTAQMNMLFAEGFSDRKVETTGELTKSTFQAGISVKEDEQYLYLYLEFGKLFAAEDVSAELRSGRLVVTMQNKELAGRLEVDAQRAVFGMNEFRSRGPKKEGTEVYTKQAFKSSSMVSLPAQINLSVDPVIELENGVLTVQILKYLQKKIEIKKNKPGSRVEKSCPQVLSYKESQTDTDHEFENELK